MKDNITANSKWHSYRLEERNVPWKIFLPITRESNILGLGMKGADLASLGRSWKLVDTYECDYDDIEWAKDFGRSLSQEYQFTSLSRLPNLESMYSAIAVNCEPKKYIGSSLVLKLLKPGGSVAWIGSRRNTPSYSSLEKQGYLDIRPYAFLPPGVGKILVPLRWHKSTLTGLTFYNPGKWSNRLMQRMAKVLTQLRQQKLLGVKQVIVARKPGSIKDKSYFLKQLSSFVGCPVADATIYSGWRNVTLQLLDDRNTVVGIAKVADTILGAYGIEKEAESLRSLGNKMDIRDYIPKIIATGKWHEHSFQIQEAVKQGHKGFTNRFTEDHEKFLFRLSRIDASEMPLEKWSRWNEINRWANDKRFFSSEAERKLIADLVEHCRNKFRKKKICFHRVHGDFVPWNIIYQRNGIKVIDWQDSEPLGLPLYDMIYFILRRNIGKNIPLEKLLKDPISHCREGINLMKRFSDSEQNIERVRLAIIAYLESVTNISGGT